MEAKFSEHGVVPDVVDVAPKETAKVIKCSRCCCDCFYTLRLNGARQNNAALILETFSPQQRFVVIVTS